MALQARGDKQFWLWGELSLLTLSVMFCAERQWWLQPSDHLFTLDLSVSSTSLFKCRFAPWSIFLYRASLFFFFFNHSWCVDLEKKKECHISGDGFIWIGKNKIKIRSQALHEKRNSHLSHLCSFSCAGKFLLKWSTTQLYSLRCNACFKHKMGIFAWLILKLLQVKK